MPDSSFPSSRGRLDGLSPLPETAVAEARDERILDEPLASGQRKRYLASLTPAAASF